MIVMSCKCENQPSLNSSFRIMIVTNKRQKIKGKIKKLTKKRGDYKARGRELTKF